jgi:hypothetical protein
LWVLLEVEVDDGLVWEGDAIIDIKKYRNAAFISGDVADGRLVLMMKQEVMQQWVAATRIRANVMGFTT